MPKSGPCLAFFARYIEHLSGTMMVLRGEMGKCGSKASWGAQCEVADVAAQTADDASSVKGDARRFVR